jgi:hypothetical protein
MCNRTCGQRRLCLIFAILDIARTVAPVAPCPCRTFFADNTVHPN